MSDRSTPPARVSICTDAFHYEDGRNNRFPVTLFFEDKGIWVNAHDDFEILYVKAGRIRLYVDDTLLILHAGEAAVIDPRSVHFGFLDAGTRHYAILCRDQPILRNDTFPEARVFEQIMHGELHFARRTLTQEQDPEIMDVIRQLTTVCRERDPYWRLTVMSLFYAFAAACLRSGFLSTQDSAPVQHTDTHKSDIALYLQFTQYVNQNYAMPLSVSSIAMELGVSESKLFKVCRSIQGYAPIVYILNRRLREAERLLRTGEKNITEVCYTCGFGTVSYFIARFRAKYGMTPKQFRESCTEK